MSIHEIKLNARKALEGKWGKGALIVLCYVLIMIVISRILSLVPIIRSIVSIIISLPIAYGLTAVFIKLKRNEAVSYLDFLREAFSNQNFGKIWGVFGRVLLKMIVPIILIIISYFLIFMSIFIGLISDSTALSLFLLGFILMTYIFSIVATIYATAKELLYILSYYILFDNPNMSSKEIVEESERLMKGNRMKYFWLELSFLGWLILSIFTLYIGLLWVIPYIEVAIVCFYEMLSNKNQEAIVETVENDNPISE